MLDGYEQYNISSSSFEEFIFFLFDHNVIEAPEKEVDPEPWYYHAEVEFNPVLIARYYIRLFKEPEFLLSKYSLDKLEQGFWAIQSSNIECAVTEVIWDENIPFDTRKECVKSMYCLYKKLFLKESLDTSVNMWWDSLAYDWCCGNRSRGNGGEDKEMQDVMFETLTNILNLKSDTCQFAALHGLGHLMHPETENLIKDLVSKNVITNNELKEYAKDAADFDVM